MKKKDFFIGLFSLLCVVNMSGNQEQAVDKQEVIEEKDIAQDGLNLHIHITDPTLIQLYKYRHKISVGLSILYYAAIVFYMMRYMKNCVDMCQSSYSFHVPDYLQYRI